MRKRTGCGLALGLLVALGLGAHVAVSPTQRWTVRRGDGSPAAGATVAFHFRGERFNFVDSIGYELSGGLARTGADGVLELPARLGRKGPLDSMPAPSIDLLYDPGSHTACALWRLGEPVAGDCAVRPEAREIVLAGRGADPVAWERSLGELHSLAWSLLAMQEDRKERRIAATPAQIGDLRDALRWELARFHERHGAARRTPPDLGPGFDRRPEAERRAIQARIEADLAAAPTWADHLDRTWPEDLARLDRRLAGLGD